LTKELQRRGSAYIHVSSGGLSHDVFALRQDPGQRQLGRLASFPLSDGFEAMKNGQITFEVFSLKARAMPPPLAGWWLAV